MLDAALREALRKTLQDNTLKHDISFTKNYFLPPRHQSPTRSDLQPLNVFKTV